MAMAIESDLTLVLTASVDPKGMPAAATLADPRRREADYIDSLNYLIRNHPRLRRIVFIENSGWDLDRLRNAASNNPMGKEVEFISCSLNDFPRHLGKSYGELLMLDHGLSESKLVKRGRYFAKLTGRNRLLNITRLLERLETPFDFACDLRDHSIYERLGLRWAGRKGESRFFVMTVSYYDQFFRGRYREMSEQTGMYIEDLIYQCAKGPNPGQVVLRRFPVEPMFRGIAGHWGKDYGGPGERLKCSLRAALRRLTPWLHV